VAPPPPPPSRPPPPPPPPPAVGNAAPDAPPRMVARRPGADLAAEPGDTFPHPGQPIAARPVARRGRLLRIILNRGQHGAARRGHLHRHPAPRGVLDRLWQCLLHHPVSGQGYRAPQPTSLARR